MGQAKSRGTREERIQQAKEKQKQVESPTRYMFQTRPRKAMASFLMMLGAMWAPDSARTITMNTKGEILDRDDHE